MPRVAGLGQWDYWALNAATWGPIRSYRWNPRNASPMVELDEIEREAWVRSMVALARRRARDRIAAEVEAGCWWVPRGFTVTELDTLIAEVYR